MIYNFTCFIVVFGSRTFRACNELVTLVIFNFGKSIFVHSFSSFNISLLTTFFHKNVVQAVIFFDNLNAYYDFCDSDD